LFHPKFVRDKILKSLQIEQEKRKTETEIVKKSE